eukprot:m51a1_g185 hypothetical protein (332) ;mRNA; r:602611-603696
MSRESDPVASGPEAAPGVPSTTTTEWPPGIVAAESDPLLCSHGAVRTEGDGESHYWVYGLPSARASATAPRVVLLMGLGWTHYGWEMTIAQLASRGCLVAAPDNRGVGASRATPGPYTTSAMARDTREGEEAAQGPAVHVVGISMGGMIAQELALLCPAAVASLALVATHAGGHLLAVCPAFSSLRHLAAVSFATDASSSVRSQARLLWPEAFLKDNEDKAVALLQHVASFGPRPPRSAYRAQVAATLTHDTRARLPQLRGLHAVVITGSDDAMVNPRHSKAISEALGCELLTRQGAGHAVTFDEDGWGWFHQHLWAHITFAPDRSPPAPQ